MAKARILAVDDQAYFRTLLAELLGGEGYEVETVSGGEEALDRLRSSDYDLLLTDLVMPGMDGRELVHRAKERAPDLDVIVVTSVGDVPAAVEAMRMGAMDYLLKPIDEDVLLRAADRVLRQRRLREEHARLINENLEFMGAFSLYERALTLFSTLHLGPLADRIAEGLGLETGAQGAVVWVDEADGLLLLAAARGIVRVEQERHEILLDALPEEFLPESGDPKPLEGAWIDEEGGALYVPFVHEGRPVALARLTDKLDAKPFADGDRVAVETFARFGALAIANALRFRALEQQSFRDPATDAYTAAYFEDVVRNEILKSSRFGRCFSLLRVEPGQPAGGSASPPSPGSRRSASLLGQRLARALRATDLLAVDSQQRYLALLPETDALGAARLKRRLRETLQQPGQEGDSREDMAVPAIGSVTYPAHGVRFEALALGLEDRADADRHSPLWRLPRGAPFRRLLQDLLEDAAPGPAELMDQVVRFLLCEVGRRSHERGVLFLAPGAAGGAALREGLAALQGLDVRTEIVLMAERPAPTGVPVTWISPTRLGTEAAFLVYCGEGPAYLLAQNAACPGDAPRLFHSSDRSLVEHLSFELARLCGVRIDV